ncbi:MAG: Dps family protein [Rickettsiales bacterium]
MSITDHLQKALAESYILLLKTHNYHWNVVGEHFNHLHTMFQTQYEDLFLGVDAIAERIRAHAKPAMGSFKEFSKLSSISEASTKLDWKKMVKDLHGDQLKICKTLAACLKASEKAGDQVTVDLMVQRMTIHQKNAWMLGAILA